jgi:hypothetical protein
VLREYIISFARGREGRWKRWVEETERVEGGRTETKREKERKKQLETTKERHETVRVPWAHTRPDEGCPVALQQ